MSIVDSFKETFSQLDFDAIDHLDRVYDTNIEFIDPFHRWVGIENVKKYLGYQYKSVIDCRFEYPKTWVDDDSAMIVWNMYLKHKWLGLGKPLVLQGVTHIVFGEKVFYQRDFYDSNEFIFENIPGVASLVKMGKGFLNPGITKSRID